jgi:hypothetical protein
MDAEMDAMGEESGREEAADDYPYQDTEASYRKLYRRGRARAQGFYALSGRAARVFAQSWAAGYRAACRILQEFAEEDGK